MKYLILLASFVVFASVNPQEEADFNFTYKVEISKPAGEFQHMQVWIPVASNNLEQKIVEMKVSTPLHYEITQEKQFGNKMLFLNIPPTTSFPAVISVEYTVHRKGATSHVLEDFTDQEYWRPNDYLGVSQKIPITGEIAKLAAAQTKRTTAVAAKITKIFKYVTDTMTYNKDGTGWGQGDAIWACDNKRGNCTDFHSLLIGMARSQKIPARFEMGFPIPATDGGSIPGYHCWARVYSNAKGWIPLDSSEAKQQGKMFEYLGYLPPDRIQFTAGRDITLEPRQGSAPLNYFIYPYLEIDGKKSDVYKKEFSFRRLL